MNQKKRSIIIILILLILITSLSIIGVFFNSTSSNNLTIGISDYHIFNDKTVVYTLNDLYFVKNSYGAIEAIDSSNNKYFEVKGILNNVSKTKNGYIVYSSGQNILLKSDYQVLYRTTNDLIEIKDDITSKSYYYETGEDKNILYDSNLNEVLNLSINNNEQINILYIVANKVYTDSNSIIDIQTKKVIDNYDEIIHISSDYYLIKNKTQILLVNKKDNTLININSYYKKNNRYILSSSDKTIIIGENNRLFDDINKIYLNNDYYLDDTTCDTGFILKNKDNSSIYNECSLSYDISQIKNNVLIVEKLNDKYILVIDNKPTNEYDYMKIEGDYIYAEGSSNKVYDLKGFTVLEDYKNIIDFTYINNNQYIAYNQGDNIKLLDNELKLIETYDEFNCDNNICITSKNNKYGLYFNGKQQIDNKYLKIEKNKSNYVLSSLSFDAILEFNNVKQNKSLDYLDELDANYYKDINIDDIIYKYNLETIREDINKNQEFFKKYAYIAEHNNKINNYKDKVYTFYKAIIENINYINEDKLLYGLKELGIENEKNLSIYGAAGIYTDNDKKIAIRTDQIKPSVYYHELYHFLDFNSNYPKINNRYICNNALYKEDEYQYLNNYEKNKCYTYITPKTTFITEAGAEIYSTDYFIEDGVTTAYPLGTYVYEVLNYIFSNSTMKLIFYTNNSSDAFFHLLVEDLKMPIIDYENMVNIFNKLTTISSMNDTNILNEAKEWLIYLYKLKNPTSNYQNDKEFLYYLRYSKGSDNYLDSYKKILHNINESILINIYGSRKGYNIKEFKVKDEGTYIYISVLDSNYSIIDYIRVLYDFKNNKIIEYKRIEGA